MLYAHSFVDASRVILPLPGHKAVRVLDFNVPKMTANTDVLISDSIFKKSFTSRLPYASYRRTVPEDLRDPATVSFMLDDERVVVLRVSGCIPFLAIVYWVCQRRSNLNVLTTILCYRKPRTADMILSHLL